MTIDRILSILAARWRLLLGYFTLFVFVAVALATLLPKRYTSIAQVIVDVHAPDPVLGTTVQVVPQGYIATQVDVIRSERVARQVVAELDPASLDDERERWQDETGERGDFAAWMAEALLRRVEVRPSRDSGVITIVYSDRRARRAAEVVNGFARVYIDTSLALKRGPALQSSTFFDERIRSARAGIESAQASLSQYQRQHDVLAGESPLNVENQRLSELVSQLSAIQAMAGESRSRENAIAARGAAASPEIQANLVVVGLKAELARAEARRKELSIRVGPMHPEYQSADGEYQLLRDRLENESRQVARAMSTATAVNLQREAQIRAAVEAQRARVLKLKEDYDQLAALERDVEAARRQFDIVSQRHTLTTLESQNRQTNVAVLTPAIESAAKVFPKDLPFLAVGLVVGSILSVLLALLTEWRWPRVRSAVALQDAMDLPVFGELPGARSRRAVSPIPLSRPSLAPRLPPPEPGYAAIEAR